MKRFLGKVHYANSPLAPVTSRFTRHFGLILFLTVLVILRCASPCPAQKKGKPLTAYEFKRALAGQAGEIQDFHESPYRLLSEELEPTDVQPAENTAATDSASDSKHNEWADLGLLKAIPILLVLLLIPTILLLRRVRESH